MIFIMFKFPKSKEAFCPSKNKKIKTTQSTKEEVDAGDSDSRVELLSFQESLCISCYLRYNKLLAVISQSLNDIVKALKGLVVMSSELELMANSLFSNAVPDMWKGKASETQPRPAAPYRARKPRRRRRPLFSGLVCCCCAFSK